MTRKKTLTKDAALLEALRSNLHLLGEIAMRYEVETQPSAPRRTRPPSAAPRTFTGCWGRRWRNWPRSSFGCCYLDTKNNVVGQRVVYQGNVSSAIVRPAEVLRPAVIEAVPSIIVSHNHPSVTTRRPARRTQPSRGSWRRRPSCWASSCSITSSSAGRSSSASRSGASWPDAPQVRSAHAVRPARGGFALPRIIRHQHKERYHACDTRPVCRQGRRPRPRRPVYDQRGRLLGHRRRLRPRPRLPGTLVPVDGGLQTALKAIWASLLKQPPEVAHLIKGADGMALSGGYQRCSIPYNTIGTWTTKIARLPVSPADGTRWSTCAV